MPGTGGIGFTAARPLSEAVRLGLSRLVSAYFLSQNTIHSTSPILFMRSAEQALPVAVSVEFPSPDSTRTFR